MSRQTDNKELKAIRQIHDALAKLDPGGQRRVLGYVGDRINDEHNAPLEVASSGHTQLVLPKATTLSVAP